MSRIDDIRERLATLAPLKLEIEDESAQHVGHAGARGGGGHFRVTMVSECFRGIGTLARHRMIYGALGEMMQGPIHALAIKALTVEEADTLPTMKEDR